MKDVNVFGKTGTAENKGMDNAWFVCFAEKGDKRIALCVFVQNAGFGAVAAAPVAFELVQEYYYPKAKQIREEENKRIADSLKASITNN